jgi:hypothetical protein
MARWTDKERLERVLELLAGLNQPEIRAAIEPRGFGASERDEGFRLLREACDAFFAHEAVRYTDAELSELRAWQTRWFGIARAALEHRFPAIAEKLFSDLVSASDVAGFAVVTVREFLERIAALEKSKSKEQLAARQLLRVRGLNEARIAEARELLHRCTTLPAAAPAQPGPTRAAALDAAWAFYLEWSEVARTVVKAPRVLRKLGFRAAGAKRGNRKHPET